MTTTNAGGGDYQGLPTAPVQHRGGTKRVGLDWATINAQYIANNGHVDEQVWPKTSGKVQVVGKEGISRHRLHTWAEATEYEGPGQPGKVAEPQPRRKVLTPAERTAVARRYADGQSTNALAREFDVSTKAISNAVIANGGRLRTLTEAAANRRARGN